MSSVVPKLRPTPFHLPCPTFAAFDCSLLLCFLSLLSGLALVLFAPKFCRPSDSLEQRIATLKQVQFQPTNHMVEGKTITNVGTDSFIRLNYLRRITDWSHSYGTCREEMADGRQGSEPPLALILIHSLTCEICIVNQCRSLTYSEFN